ncbi:MAG: hypothetical protein ACK5JT_24140 [Hyphomicrobiaceae bacterium]
MHSDTTGELTHKELKDFKRLAGLMVPASTAYAVPGADDEAIFSDIVRSLGQDSAHVKQALADLDARCGSAFADLGTAEAEQVAMSYLTDGGAGVGALGRAILQCYYRDDRVVRSLGLEPRAPFPKGHTLEQGDWSLLDAVSGRPAMWRDVDGTGGHHDKR